MLPFRLPRLLVLAFGLMTLTGCFEAGKPIFTANDLWTDMPAETVQTLLAGSFFPEREMGISHTGGGTFAILADGTECPFGIVNMQQTDAAGAMDIAVFNLKPDCHFNMADSPWMVYAAQIFPPGHPRHDTGISFGVPGDSGAITTLAQERGVQLEVYKTSGEDRYRILSDPAMFKAFLAPYMRSGFVDFGQ